MRKKTIGIVATAIALAVIGVAIRDRPPHEKVTVAPHLSDSPIREAREATEAAPFPAPERDQRPSVAEPLTRAQQIDALLKTKNPVQAYAAYKLVQACMFSRTHEVEARESPSWAQRHHWTPPTATCGDITPGQIVARLQGLGIAADAGVHGAMRDFATEGPDGAGWAVPHDPVVIAAWNERAKAQVKAGVASGDLDAISTAFAWYHGGGVEGNQDLPQALKYAVAWNEVSIAQTGKAANGALVNIEGLTAALPAEQAATAIEAGRKLVATAKMSPLWSNQ